MEREEIVRADFPTARKGWSPDAVEAHLIVVAEYVAATSSVAEASPPRAADVAGERVRAVLTAAESAAAEILAEAETEASRIVGAARAEADQIRAAARTESEATVTAASQEASGRVEQAQAAVEGLVAQADKLRAQVGALGREIAANVPGVGPRSIPDEDPPHRSAEPELVPEAATKPDTEPKTAATSSDPGSAKPAPDGPVSAEPTAPTPPPSQPAPSNEDLIARLRGGGETAAAEEAPRVAPTSASEHGAARLVAMNMALDGASREQIGERIEAEFSRVEGVDELLDDVLSRAGR